MSIARLYKKTPRSNWIIKSIIISYEKRYILNWKINIFLIYGKKIESTTILRIKLLPVKTQTIFIRPHDKYEVQNIIDHMKLKNE